MKKRLNISLDNESILYIEEIAKSRNISKTKAIENILKEHLLLYKINSTAKESKLKRDKSLKLKRDKSLEKILAENTWEISNLKNKILILESRLEI